MAVRLSHRAGVRLLLAVGLAATLVAAPALAVPVNIIDSNLGTCDPLDVGEGPLAGVHELGLPAFGFPQNESVLASSFDTADVGCAGSDTGGQNVALRIRNRTGQDWSDVWYVADPETLISNADGLVNGQLAFRIDTVGANAPLISESITPDGIFEDDELWTLVLDDFFNADGFGPDLLTSVGLVGDLSGGLLSSGSIIASNVPEPSTALLLGLGLAAVAVQRRSV